jgi:hypothetical protein
MIQVDYTMKRYRNFQPTPFDVKGLGGADADISDWFVVPVSIDRDTPKHTIEAVNFDVIKGALEKANPDGEDWEIHRFNHWGPGWFEIIVVRPDTESARIAQEMADVIEDYPVLDDEELSMREWDACHKAWEQMSLRERIHFLHRRAPDISFFAARSDDWSEIAQLDDCGCLGNYILGHY